MILRILTIFAFAQLLVAGVANAAGPLEQAHADLNKAVEELNSTQLEYAGQRRTLYREINRLDDDALKLSKELRTLERDEQRRTARVKTLDLEVAARKADFDYASGVLNQYSKALITRLHPAENQLYKQELGEIDQRALAAADLPKVELQERIKALDLGIGRLGRVAGGHQFDGKALRNGSEAVDGQFLLVGPSVFFAEKKPGGFEGVATFAETGTSLPTVVAIKGADVRIAEGVSLGHGKMPFDGTMGKAIEVAAAQESLLDVIEKGGVVGHAILTLGAISLMIAMFKVIQVSRIRVPSRSKINAILDDLLNGDREAAAIKAAKIPGVAGEMVMTGVDMFYEKRRVLEEALFEKLISVKPVLDKYLPFLALTAAASPLMGLLGTVLGIIKTFKAMALYGTGNAKSFSAGISEALITTAEGLVVAIPVLVIHGMLKSYTKSRYSEFESIGISLVNGTTEREKRSASVEATEKPDDAGDDDMELNPTPA